MLATVLTEQRNPRTVHLDRMSAGQIVDVMLAEELRALPKIRTQKTALVRVIGWIVAGLRRGGRLIYVGAGTSGRLGALDAAECPPTFGVSPQTVQAIIAGGPRALLQSVEAAEDNAVAGARAIRARRIGRTDVVVGIAASGTTPFVLGALTEAHRRGARMALVTFNPASPFRLPAARFQKIAVATGPEVLTGSTRLKAGTATKIILNMLSTAAMVRLGRVRSNFMICFAAWSNAKLRDRAVRIYRALCPKVSEAEARHRLADAGWDLHGLLAKRPARFATGHWRAKNAKGSS